MKKLPVLNAFLFMFIFFQGLTAQVVISDDGGVIADPSSVLDLQSTNKGFLLPRLSIAEIETIPSPAEGLTVYNTDTHKPVYYNGTDWLNYDGSQLLSIGDYAFGGVVFYLDGNGGGLVCAISDQSDYAEWGCLYNEISGADGTALGTGAQNTVDILAECSTPDIAADICADLILNGYDDWFLPSKDELNEMYQNKDAIDATAVAYGGTSFDTEGYQYWSSTEYNVSDPDRFAWAQLFGAGNQLDIWKDTPSFVRAIRAF